MLDSLQHAESTSAKPPPEPVQGKRSQKNLDDNVLFQLPFPGSESAKASNKFGRHEKKLLGLWQAYEDGVHPVIMHRRKPSNNIPKEIAELAIVLVVLLLVVLIIIIVMYSIILDHLQDDDDHP